MGTEISITLVHKHVKISVDKWALETTRPHKHVTILDYIFVSIFCPELNWTHHFFNNEDELISVWASGFKKSFVHFINGSNSLTKPL